MISLLPLASNVGLVRSLPAAQYPYGLNVGGVDVIGKVPAESIRVTEAGPGGVSSMSFTILDPTLVVEIADGAEVRFHDYLRNLPVFTGWLESVTYSPWAAAGRMIEVSAYGIESVLDTVIVTSMTRTNYDRDSDSNGYSAPEVLQALVGLTGLRAGKDTLDSFAASSLTLPIAPFELYYMAFTPSVVLDGMTVRNAIQAYMDACDLSSPDPIPMFLSVDFWGGVRFWSWLGNWSPVTYASLPGPPSDYAVLTVTNTPGGAVAATSIRYQRDVSPGAIVNAVYVKGATPDGTGWVVGNTTTGRHQAYTSSESFNQFTKSAVAAAILSSKQKAAGRGTLTLENFTPINAHPGGPLVITDANLGWSNQKALITQIEKTISNKVTGTQDWTVSFVLITHGPSSGRAGGSRYRRQLTRGTLN